MKIRRNLLHPYNENAPMNTYNTPCSHCSFSTRFLCLQGIKKTWGQEFILVHKNIVGIDMLQPINFRKFVITFVTFTAITPTSNPPQTISQLRFKKKKRKRNRYKIIIDLTSYTFPHSWARIFFYCSWTTLKVHNWI